MTSVDKLVSSQRQADKKNLSQVVVTAWWGSWVQLSLMEAIAPTSALDGLPPAKLPQAG
jgi:hypothetical protein